MSEISWYLNEISKISELGLVKKISEEESKDHWYSNFEELFVFREFYGYLKLSSLKSNMRPTKCFLHYPSFQS